VSFYAATVNNRGTKRNRDRQTDRQKADSNVLRLLPAPVISPFCYLVRQGMPRVKCPGECSDPPLRQQLVNVNVIRKFRGNNNINLNNIKFNDNI